ncbi:hypothetical protein LCGC14_1535590 [marine sediment metagenome]|uniref:Fibronectin type-III domain-containing protein n=1 Tax=marine sediment metagenome TaxID=412755 RepID=A0A0F9IUM6_9ZZZZ
MGVLNITTLYVDSITTTAAIVHFSATSLSGGWFARNGIETPDDGSHAWFLGDSNPADQRVRFFGLESGTDYSAIVTGRETQPDEEESSGAIGFSTLWSSVPTKADTPSPTDANTSVTLDQATISWNDGGGADTFDVYYGTTSGNLTKVSDTQAGTSFIVTGITDGSPYVYLSVRYWRIDSTNTFGTTTGDEWSFTTIRIDPPTKTYFYATTGQYYYLLVQSDGSYGDPPGVGVENTDYVFLVAGYEFNVIATTRKLVSAANSKIWYESI